MVIRFSTATLFGFIVTLALFYLMQGLIVSGKSVMTPILTERLVNFVRIKQPMQVPKTQQTPKPIPPAVQPPKPAKPDFTHPGVTTASYNIGPLENPVSQDPQGTGFTSDGDYLPVVKVQPIYPQRALSRGLSGWVIVRFTVTSNGTVSDPVVVQHCAWIKAPQSQKDCRNSPNAVFDSAAIQAARKFKYKPRILDGQPLDTTGVENRITFELTGNGG